VSTDRQAEQGVSLEAQVEKIKAMSTVTGSDLIDIIIESGESGKNLQRPGMTRLLELVRSKSVDVVIVCKLDRLTRSVRDLSDLLDLFGRKGCALVSVAEALDTSTASGRLVINVLASFAQFERELIGERTRDALAHLKQNGRYCGNAPYGFRLGQDRKHVEPDPGEQAILRRIVEARRRGKSLRDIAAQLNRQGHRTRSNAPWKFEYVHRVLKAA
jgi:DNA invertase Pin-like site-specific DNA recombinase